MQLSLWRPSARPRSAARSTSGRYPNLGPAAQLLRVLHVTDPIPPDGFVVAPTVDDAQRATITAALLAMHQNDAGKTALAEVLQAERLAPVNDALLRSLRSWSEAAAARAT